LRLKAYQLVLDVSLEVAQLPLMFLLQLLMCLCLLFKGPFLGNQLLLQACYIMLQLLLQIAKKKKSLWFSAIIKAAGRSLQQSRI